MKTFLDWLTQKESSARTRAALDPGKPAQADLVFVKAPKSIDAFCDKIKAPGVKLQNIDAGSVCHKKKK